MEDYELLKNFKAGSEEANGIIFKRYYKRLCAAVWKVIGYDRAEAEDIVLTAMISLFTGHRNFEHINQVEYYLFKSVRNSALNNIKMGMRRRQREANYFNEQPLTTDDDVEWDIWYTEALELVHLEMEKLPEQCGRIIKMLYEGATPAMVAQELGISVNTVYVQKMRAEIKFKEALIKVYFKNKK